MKKLVSVRSFYVLLLFGILFVPLLTLFVHDASATAPGYARWILDVSFDETGSSHPQGKEIIAEWTVQVEDQSGTVVASQTELLDCSTVGTMSYSGSVALLNGGHITCTMPSFADAVFQLTGRTVPMNGGGYAHCNTDVDLWVRTYAKPFLNLSSTNPVFHHPSFSYQITNNSGGETSLLANLWQPTASVSTEVSPMPIDSGFNQIGTRLNQCEQGECIGKHRVFPSTAITETVSYPSAQFPQLYVDETPVNIGFDPLTQDNFQGLIYTLHADPGCVVEAD